MKWKMETKNTIGYISFVDFQYSYPEQEYFEGREHWKLRPLFKDTFHF